MINKFSRKKYRERANLLQYAISVFIALVALLIVYLLEGMTQEKFSNINSLLIISVLVSSIYLGKFPAILNAIICCFGYDLLIVPPFFASANNYDNLIKFSVFLLAAFITNWIAGKSRSYAFELQRNEIELRSLLQEKEELQKQKDAETAKREMEAFRVALLASISHDLKTPLASIIGSVSSLSLYHKQLSEIDIYNLIETILLEATRLLNMVNNILEMVKIESGMLTLKTELIAIEDVIDLTIKRLKNRLSKHQVKISIAKGDLYFCGDEKLMDIVIGNLLDNAVKYSLENSRILINCYRNRGTIIIDISDEGIGIPLELMGENFDKKYPLEQNLYQKTDSTGLGLWIAKRIVEFHHGSLEIIPVPIGALIRIMLPLEKSNLTVEE